MTTTLVVVQARLGSTRLPRKIEKPVAGAPVLVRMLERVRAARTPFDLVVATTTDPEDEAVVETASAAGFDVFRGHPDDLLDRHYQAAKAHGADVVVKIPSDVPLIDPRVIDRVFDAFFSDELGPDFTSNLHPATYPDGHDVEIMTMEALEIAWREATREHERQHTTPYIWDTARDRFRITNVEWETGRDLSMSHRFTIDYEEDYAFVSRVYDELYTEERPVFALTEILALLEAKPEIYALNAKYAGVNWYRNHLDDLETIDASQTKRIEETD